LAKSDIIVLIPSYNELVSLKKFLPLLNKKYKFLIINDCSIDGTEKYLKEKKYIFISNKKRLGYEKSLIRGFKYILKKFKSAKYIITFDGDNQHFVNDLKKFTNAIKLTKPVLIVGNRKKYNRYLEIFISYIFFKKFQIRDPLSGFKAYKTKTLKKNLNQLRDGMYLVKLTKTLIQKYKNVKNIKINIRPRIGTPRIGGLMRVNLIMVKILLFIIFTQ
tara:strand:+ start:1242 stop:1895 length:654 start_codon:yes stop_codon:yes gene_type:complete